MAIRQCGKPIVGFIACELQSSRRKCCVALSDAAVCKGGFHALAPRMTPHRSISRNHTFHRSRVRLCPWPLGDSGMGRPGMTAATDLSGLIDAIYDADVDARRWTEVCARIGTTCSPGRPRGASRN
jgi:hypothetical protein